MEISRIGKSKAWVRRRLHDLPERTLYNWLSGDEDKEPAPHIQGMVIEILRTVPSKYGDHPDVKR